MSSLASAASGMARATGTFLIAVLVGLFGGLMAVGLGKKALVVVPVLVGAAAMLMTPYSALYAIVAIVPMNLTIVGPITVTRLVVLFAFVIITFQVFRREIPKPQLLLGLEGSLAFLFFAWIAFGIVFGGGGELVERLGPFFIFASVFFIVLNYADSPHRLQMICLTLTICGVGQAILALAHARYGIQPFGGWQAQLDANNADGEVRVAGTTSHPIILAGYMQMVIVAAIMFVCTSSNKFLRVLTALAVPLLLAGWWHTYSRSSWVGMSVMILVGMLLVSRITRLMAIIGIVILGSLLITHDFSMRAVVDTIEGLAAFNSVTTDGGLAAGSESLQWRHENWAAAIRIFKEAPLFGVGFDLSVYQMIDNLPLGATAHNYIQPATPHNMFLHLLAETGIVALLLFLSLWAVGVQGLVRAAHHPELRPFAIGALTILAGLGTTFFFNPLPRDIWFTLAFVISISRLGRQMVPLSKAPPGYLSALPLRR